MDYTVLQHVGIVRVAAVKTKTTQRMFQKVIASKMTKAISLTFVICLILKSTFINFFKTRDISSRQL